MPWNVAVAHDVTTGERRLGRSGDETDCDENGARCATHPHHQSAMPHRTSRCSRAHPYALRRLHRHHPEFRAPVSPFQEVGTVRLSSPPTPPWNVAISEEFLSRVTLGGHVGPNGTRLARRVSVDGTRGSRWGTLGVRRCWPRRSRLRPARSTASSSPTPTPRARRRPTAT
jgi:hypothetical protein